MKFFKKIFGKYNQKKQVDDYNIKSQDLVLRIIEKFKTLDDNKIEDYKTFLKEFEPTNNDQKLLLAIMKDGISYNKASRAEKIVNDYGQALMKATELNKRKVDEFFSKNKNLDLASLKSMQESLQENKAIYYHLQHKFDIRLLPYDKEIIREALEFLLQDETDTSTIEQLKNGLLFLDDFIDFSKFGS